MTLDRMKDLLSPSEEERTLSTLLVVSLHMHLQGMSGWANFRAELTRSPANINMFRLNMSHYHMSVECRIVTTSANPMIIHPHHML